MEEQWVADRLRLRTLHASHPHWSVQTLADAVGRSCGWVKKWLARLRDTSDDTSALHSHSRARKTPPPALSPLVIDRILAIRDQPPDNLTRIPGPKAILFYLHKEAATTLAGQRLPRSTRTIWRVLRQHQRILDPPFRAHQPLERPEPLSSWQLDFKDASTVPAESDGKQQHVVEVLNTVDVGTSILLSANVGGDFSMATAIEAVAQTVQSHGVPERVTFDRDARFVGNTSHRECPSPFIRFWLCLGVDVTICPPRRPDLNGFVERYHRSYDEECLQVHRPADCETVKTLTAAFQHHYNYERPHQGLSCHNQPPRVAFAELPARPAVPAVVDPDHWIERLNGQCFVRKVRRDTSVMIDTVAYYTTRAVVGKTVRLRVEAATRSFVVELEGEEVKRIPIAGTGRGECSFATFVEGLCHEARVGRLATGAVPRQLALPLE
jgi:transposase InsO family protein